ncbi:MAG: hypothetical protein CMA77_01565 [Euryarchaeota archaeon]|nr:hypothetical protein [Euryarchaeota archaeon]
MEKVPVVVWLAALLLSVTAILPVNTVAHDAGTFTVLIKSDQITPNEPQIVFNDSVWWYNVDDTENITHRIVYDADGDGLYNGTLDWDSGNLSNECDKDEYGNLTDPECRITYEIPFNGTWGPGTYNYQDILSNGVINNGTIIVLPDNHESEENSPPIGGYEFGVEDTEETLDLQDEEDNPRDWLLWVAAGSGFISLLLVGVLLMGLGDSSNNEKEDESQQNNDSDIDDIAEEE